MNHQDELITKRDLEEVKQELLAKIDANTAKIEENGRKIDANAAAISRIAVQVAANSDKITQLTAKVDKFDEYFNRIITMLDGLVADSRRFDQERAAMNSRLDRVETDVEKNKRDIREIKTKLAMP